jgi:arylsulfatase A-like enzyme
MRRALPVLALLALLAACGESPPEGPTMPLTEVQVSLVAEPGFREVLAQSEAAPVRAGTFAPQGTSSFDTGPLPALLLPPPAAVELRTGRLDGSCRLEFAVGFDRAAYEGQDRGVVRFVLEPPGGAPLSFELPYGADVPREERTWTRGVWAPGAAESFVLRTERLSGTGTPPACFASLEVVTETRRLRERATPELPNVVVLVVDTLRYDRLGGYGNPRGLTPTMDALAARGTLYEDAYSTAPWTWPSTASILTGLTPAEHGVVSHQACYLADALETLPEAVQRAGWTTGGFSANPLISASKAFDQGFERFRSYEWDHADVVVDDALAFLEELGEWRFFLYLQVVDPHDYRPSPENEARFAGEAPEGFSRQGVRNLLGRKVLGEPHDEARLESWTAHLSRLYDACVADVDAQLARIVNALQARGLLDRTLLVITSDHGEEFLDHGLLYHGSQLHRELTGIPLILAGPGIPEGGRVTERVENRFLAPTLLRRLGIEAPGNLAGLDLLDLPAVVDAAREASFVTTSQGMWPRAGAETWRNLEMHGVRLGDEFYVWLPEAPDGTDAEALFDLSADPAARLDVSAERPERCAALRTLIERWLQRGAEVRPSVLGGGEDALEMLRKLGYVDR